MGGQGIERRTILRYIGIASVAGTFPGFSQWAFACSHTPDEHTPDEHPAAKLQSDYKPLFFSSRQYAMIERLSEMILPTDDTPGAREAGVAEFIDFMVANRAPINAGDEITTDAKLRLGAQAQQSMLLGLGWLDAHCKVEFGHDFLDCTGTQQNTLLEELAYKDKFKPTTEVGRTFFQLLRDYTVIGFYTTKIGLEHLGYAGLQTFWKKNPGCTHPNDPEHANLPQPGALNLAALNIVN